MSHTPPSKTAIISLTNKQGIEKFCKGLCQLGYHILSTGGTARLLRDHGIPVEDVSEYTDSPEIFSGRVKTLHPRIHGGILYDRNNPEHVKEASTRKILPIDLVIVNLYDFKSAAAKKPTWDEVIESIDIGGPTMLRSAAKNFANCLPVIDPNDYEEILSLLQRNALTSAERRRFAGKVFHEISQYDRAIADYFAHEGASIEGADLPDELNLDYQKVESLRYGENPHQKAGLYRGEHDAPGLASAPLLQGKQLSYNNYLDLDAAYRLVLDFGTTPTLAIIKHTNPCTIASANKLSTEDLFAKALKGDPKSSFGGIVATNQVIDKDAATAMEKVFFECIVAPRFTAEAREILATKKNLRLLEIPFNEEMKTRALETKTISGGLLVQEADTASDEKSWKYVTAKQASPAQYNDLKFAFTVVGHVKSNAIVLAKDGQTIGIGAGQMSRIDSLMMAAQKAKESFGSTEGCVLASDAFFPFADCVEFAMQIGAKAIIQPGGSVRDADSITACNNFGLAMIFTGARHFRH
ncbi:MAG: bifunctional phosphoribosylaminoimidazolecarboxamide formyltransferase/IMP cyclohydrolase [Oligoflexales bacterium]